MAKRSKENFVDCERLGDNLPSLSIIIATIGVLIGTNGFLSQQATPRKTCYGARLGLTLHVSPEEGIHRFYELMPMNCSSSPFTKEEARQEAERLNAEQCAQQQKIRNQQRAYLLTYN